MHGMYTDAIEFCISCPQCVIVSGGEAIPAPNSCSKTFPDYQIVHYGFTNDKSG